MSEYVTVEVEYSADPNVAELYINQTLTDDEARRSLNCYSTRSTAFRL